MEPKMIIYPTDFSTCAENAMPYAIAMATALKCKIQIVHFVDASGILKSEENPLRVLEEIKELEIKAQNRLFRLKSNIEKSGIDCGTEVLQGDTLSWLPKYLNEKKPCLVVMGTTGAGSVENKVFGSNTYKVIKKTDFPVMTIPEKVSYKGFEKMIFATDYEEKDTENINFLVKLAKHYKASIDVVHVTETAYKNEEEKHYADNLRDEVSKTVSYGRLDYKFLYWDKIEERLEILLKESNTDLLALVERKRNFTDRLFHKSIIKKMVYHTQVPLLIFP
ncbi:universal stress protein [Maribacter arcticus]|uniref:Nucleotide-binding universal stress protein, UspA family n=1 Tax=Maribacter arcticus TaxID=561365 RepID=A0A1T5CGX3_9FLAO|nr:universal stress protein [Maribacter arcticus]SKB58593.1 Nucleotide-binding universal stress protein, UspA family [Maribacter arcticus]